MPTTSKIGLSKNEITIIAILVVGAFITFLNETLLTPAMPSIMESMQVDAATVQWLTSGYALVETVVIPLNAYLLGKLGPRKIFIAGMLLFTVSCLVCLFAPSFPVLLLGRFLQAAAAGTIIPTVFAVIVLLFPKENRGTAMGIVGLIIGVAPAIGPVISGIIVDTVGWRYEFAVVAVLTFILFFVSIAVLKTGLSFPAITFDTQSVIMLAVGMSSLLYGISTIVSAEIVLIPLSCIAVGVIVLIFFCKRQNKLEEPILKVSTLKTRRFAVCVLMALLLEGFVIATTVLFPIFMQNALGYSATVSGLMMLPTVVVGSVVGVFAGKWFDGHGIRKIALIGALMCFLGYGAFLFCGSQTPPWLICLIFTVCCIGIYSILNPVNTWGLNSLPNTDIPHGNAIIATIEQVGASLGTGLIMGLTALGPIIAGENASLSAQSEQGCFVAFVALFVLVVLMGICVIFCVKDKETDEMPPKE